MDYNGWNGWKYMTVDEHLNIWISCMLLNPACCSVLNPLILCKPIILPYQNLRQASHSSIQSKWSRLIFKNLNFESLLSNKFSTQNWTCRKLKSERQTFVSHRTWQCWYFLRIFNRNLGLRIISCFSWYSFEIKASEISATFPVCEP